MKILIDGQDRLGNAVSTRSSVFDDDDVFLLWLSQTWGCCQQVVNEYMKPDRIFIDLVKEGSVKASKDVEHIGIPCHWTR